MNSLESKNCSNIANNKLCSACGTCFAVCPQNAIGFERQDNEEYRPVINNNCQSCSLCLKVCPFYNLHIQSNNLIGDFIKLFHVKNISNQFKDSTSSGIVTFLTKHLLEQKLVDYVITVDFDDKKRFIAKEILANDIQTVEKCAGSKYQQVSLNRLLKYIKKDDKFAIVGLPCHLKGVDKFLKLKNIDLKNVYKIGLFCGHVFNFNYLEYLSKKAGINKEEISELKYRHNGWPGDILINKRTLPFKTYFLNLFQSRFFTPRACLFCDDLTAEYSDMSCGDAWNISKEKSSIVIVRNEKMIKILDNLQNLFSFQEIDENAIVKSQGSQLFFKKKNIFARIKIYNLFNKEKIQYSEIKFKNSVIDYFGAILIFINIRIKSKKILFIPDFLLNIYAKLISYSTGFYYNRFLQKWKK